MPIASDYSNAMVQLVTDTNKHTEVQPKHVYRGIMPDVKGMTLKDAIYVLENYGMHVTVLGKGKVQSQSVPEGTRLFKGQTIILQLS